MRILLDLCHPAHFHLFKNVIAALRARGDEVVILAHQKDCMLQLLDSAGWPYHLVRRTGTSLPSLAGEATRSLGQVLALAFRKPFDLMMGTSVAIGPASRVTGTTSLIFSEDDSAVVPLFASLAYSTASYVITPKALRNERIGRKHLVYDGFHELAYLHPNRFRPDPDIRRLLGVSEGQRYFLVRLVALKAHHDAGQKGIGPDQAREVVRRLEAHGRVFISAETRILPELEKYLLPVPPDRIFDVIAQADLMVGDSQTMTIEACVLGTPALRCNTFVGRLSVMEELERRYELTKGIHPREFDRLLTVMDQWLAQPDLRQQWERKRQRLLAECVDLTEWLMDLIDDLDRQRRAGRGDAFVGARNYRVLGREASRPQRAIPGQGSSFQAKYSHRNSISRRLTQGFFRDLEDLLSASTGPILDVGAGEGDAYLHLSPSVVGRGVTAVEPDGSRFARMSKVAPMLQQVQASICSLPFADKSFDTVLCSEVLEHLDDPDKGMRELVRVCRKWLVLSVPREPIWRLLNMARGAYLNRLGNSPNHVQHWSTRSFIRWVGRYAQVKEVRTPLPWTIVLACPK